MRVLNRSILLFLVIVFFTGNGCLFKSLAQEYNGKPYINSSFAYVDGVRIHYRLWQNPFDSLNNQWVLLVHGFSSSTYSWEKSIDTLLKSGFSVVAVDVPPFGYSDKNHRINHSVDNRATLFWRFIDVRFNNAKWFLVGHSMGGGIVTAMTILQPQRVEKVLLVAPSLFQSLRPGRTFRQRIMAFTPIELSAAAVGRLVFIQPFRVEKLLLSAYSQQPDSLQVDAYLKGLRVPGTARGILAAASRANPVYKLNISDFNRPAIAIWGDKDVWIPYERMKPITDEVESLSVLIIKGTGHVPHETDSDLFNLLMIRFFLQEKQAP